MAAHPLLNIAVRAARRAGDLMVRSLHRIDNLEVTVKERNEFVSEVDRAVEADILETIRRSYPDHSFLAEESGEHSGRDGEVLWIIDPLDGTTNYLHGLPQFCVSIACEIRGRLEHGVIYDPMRQELYTASRGVGAQLDGKRIRVSQRKDLHECLVGTGFPFRDNLERLASYTAMFSDVVQACAGVRRPGSAALDLAYVAAGRYDGFWEMGLKVWDLAAGVLMVREAGGLITDLAGGDDWRASGDIVAGNPKITPQLLKLLRPHLTRA